MSRPRRATFAAAVVATTVAALSASTVGPATAAAASSSASAQSVRLAVIPGGGLALYPQIVAADKRGFFRKDGVDVHRTDTGTSGDAAQLLITGNADIATITPDVAVQAISKGADFVILASTAKQAPYYLLSKDALSSPAAFKGKKLGVPQTSGTATFIAKAALAKKGLPEGSYDLIVTGKAPQRLAALSNGAVDATILPAPLNLAAERQGFHELLYAGNAIAAPGAVLVATRSFVQGHRSAVVGFLKAFLQGGAWLSNPKNRARFISDVSNDSMGQGIETADLQTTYNEFILKRKVIPTVGIVRLGNLLNQMKRYHEIDSIPTLGGAVDNRYIVQAAKSLAPKKKKK